MNKIFDRAMPHLLIALSCASVQAATFTDAAGRKVELPAKVERVYAAGPPASVAVFAIAPDKLIGWTRAFRPNEAVFVPKKYAELPELGRLTGRGNTANVEVVLKTKPDIIIDMGATNATFSSLADRVQEQTGIPYILLDGRFDKMTENMRALGKILGNEKRANELGDYMDKTLGDIRKKIETIPKDKRPTIYYGRGPQGLMTGLGGSINVEMIEFLGAINVAGREQGGLTNVGLEQVLLWNPEHIVTNDPNFYRDVWKQPVWSSVNAVKNKRVYLSPHLPFGWFDYPPGANRVLGVVWLANLLYPQLFQDDLRETVAAFHKLFYHQEPTAAQLDEILGEPGVWPERKVGK
ncbi:MAG: iron ABC transporter substrate-binding protein [Betaproteobacteria bacterium]